MHWARSTRATSQDGKWAFGDLRTPSNRLGQAPLRSPSVFNFYRPGYVPPTTSIADAGLVAPEFQITNEASTIGYINYLQEVIDGKHGTRNTGVISSAYAAEINAARGPAHQPAGPAVHPWPAQPATRTKLDECPGIHERLDRRAQVAARESGGVADHGITGIPGSKITPSRRPHHDHN